MWLPTFNTLKYNSRVFFCAVYIGQFKNFLMDPCFSFFIKYRVLGIFLDVVRSATHTFKATLTVAFFNFKPNSINLPTGVWWDFYNVIKSTTPIKHNYTIKFLDANCYFYLRRAINVWFKFFLVDFNLESKN